MSNDQKTYRAICFDLDGTLLPMDLNEFMTSYFTRITTFMHTNGVDSNMFMEGLKAGIKAMSANTGEKTNDKAFWQAFYKTCDISEKEKLLIEKTAERFYAEDFCHIGDNFVASPASANVVQILREKGYPLLLTTMPMFPKQAVEHRLRWTGIDPSSFERITHYENSKSVKPHLTYFAENLAAMGLNGEDVLMVGNNTLEDFAFLELGADPYLITDCLLNPIDMDLNTIRHGSMADFEAWVTALPECTNPAGNVKTGEIDSEATLKALEANKIR